MHRQSQQSVCEELRQLQQEGFLYYSKSHTNLSNHFGISRNVEKSQKNNLKSKIEMDQDKLLSDGVGLISDHLSSLQEIYISFEKESYEKFKILEQVDYEKSSSEISRLHQLYIKPFKYINIDYILGAIQRAESSVVNNKNVF
ncbi:hypothetical protein AKO1_002183 [Acrasis kona]|uniref:Uncharacterized protein n=1 Tax=Acrasis kona TaxID=1008807 RepID=A0AAW2Z7W8_9EUKA